MAEPAVIRCALLDRAAAIDALWIWREASQWLVDRGLPLWQPSIFDEQFIDDSLALGPIVAAWAGGELGGVALLHWTDEIWWPDRPAGEAGYIHKVAVAPPAPDAASSRRSSPIVNGARASRAAG